MKKYKIDNYLIEANSPIEAMKAVKTLKDAGYYWNDIREMCIRNNWYTYGTNREYNNLFEKATGGQWKAEQIAQDIATHSRPDAKYEDILREVKRLHVYDSKVKDDNIIMYKGYKLVEQYGLTWHHVLIYIPEIRPGPYVTTDVESAKHDIDKYLRGDKTVFDSLHKSKVKDEAFDRQTIEALIADETAAIDAYNVAIANLKGKLSDEAIKVLQAIRDDEQNHVANLNAILSNNITEKNLEDSIKDAEYKAFYKGKELKRGDELVDFRGDKSYYYGCYHPRKITVSEDKVGNNLTEAYPSVFNVEIKV